MALAMLTKKGYGQVEPNHLSAQRTGQIYAQLPLEAGALQAIGSVTGNNCLENGQFLKYDYKNGVADVTGAGEWLLVFNEVKVYRAGEGDKDFAMFPDQYAAKVYSPGGVTSIDGQSRYYGATDAAGNANTGKIALEDKYEPDTTNNPFGVHTYRETKMKDFNTDTVTVTAIVPRLFKTNIGDIFTTNYAKIDNTYTDAQHIGKFLVMDTLNNAGIPVEADTLPNDGKMAWEIVKVTTTPDHQKALKIMRVQ